MALTKWKLISCAITAMAFFNILVFSKGAGMETDKGKEAPEGIEISERISPVKKVKVTAQDGNSIEIAMRIPPGKGPFPAVIFIHGGMSEGAIDNLRGALRGNPLCTRFLAAGYVSVHSTFRNYEEKSRDPGPILDNSAVIDYVKKMPEVDSESVVVFGSSGGGRLALELAGLGEHTGLAAIACWEPATTLYAEMYPRGMRGPNMEICKNHEKYFKEENRRILKEKVKKLSCPIIIVHSDVHPINNVNNGYLIPEIKAQKKSLKTILYPGFGHGFCWGRAGATKEAFERMVNDVRNFYGQHLEVKPVPITLPGQPNARQSEQAPAKPAPTYEDIAYGPHERNVLDFWQTESTSPTPLVVYIHGGGFTGGNKKSLNARTLQELLDAGISVAAVNYRLMSHAPLPAAHYDCRQALQLLRSKAKEWNIDKTRVGAFGGSAGAQICMWLAFHDEMADPESSDPLKQESTRLTCVATSGGQTTMDVDWWKKWIPGYESPHRDFFGTFGVQTQEEYLEKVAEVAALSLISEDDPPIFMTYGMAPDDPVPTDPQRARGWKVHHVMFGVKLKEKMDELGIEADLKYSGAHTTYGSISHFSLKN